VLKVFTCGDQPIYVLLPLIEMRNRLRRHRTNQRHRQLYWSLVSFLLSPSTAATHQWAEILPPALLNSRLVQSKVVWPLMWACATGLKTDHKFAPARVNVYTAYIMPPHVGNESGRHNGHCAGYVQPQPVRHLVPVGVLPCGDPIPGGGFHLVPVRHNLVPTAIVSWT
jgi:hypothetical protein